MFRHENFKRLNVPERLSMPKIDEAFTFMNF